MSDRTKGKAPRASSSQQTGAQSGENTSNKPKETGSAGGVTPKRIRAASASDVDSLKPTSLKSVVTQASSLDGHKLATPYNSGERGVVAPSLSNYQPAQLPATTQPKRTFSGKHRQSGLFSKDDLSADISCHPSSLNPAEQAMLGQGGRSGSVGRSQEGGEGDKNYPMSLGGSSAGSRAFSEIGELERKQMYKPFRRKWRRFRRKYKGCIFALLSSITSSLASYFVKMLSDTGRYSPAYCMLWRYFGVFFPGIFIVLFYRFCHGDMVFDTVWPLKEKEPIKRFILSVARAVIDVAAVLLNYLAFEYLLQSETSTILNSKPIVVQLLAHFTLGEAWGIVPILMSVVAVIGVIVMSRPPFLLPPGEARNDGDFVTKRLPGVLYCLGSMFLSSIVYCILRYLKDVHYSVFSLFIGAVGLIFALGMTFGLNQFVVPGSLADWTYFTAVALLVCFSSIAIVIALQNEEAFVVSLVRSCDVIFSFIWEMSIDHKYPDWYRGGGALIIMFCVVVIFFRKYLTHQEPESKVYKAFYFLTK